MELRKNTGVDVSEQMATAPVGKLLLKLAVPTVLAQLVNLLYNIVDRIYIGHMPEVGDVALTGVGLCFPVIYLISAFTMLIAQGGAPRAAIWMGKGDREQAERILGNCFTMLIILSVLLTGVFLYFGEPLLWLFGASENTIDYALSYMQIYTAGSLFVMLALGLNMFITTQGFTKYSMVAVVIGAVTNIILDPIFIYGLHMGVPGAALATILSQALSAVFILRFLFGKQTKLRIRRSYLRLQPQVILPVMALGLAPFIMQATEAILNVSFNSSLQRYGGDVAVGAMTIASTVMQMVWLPAQGIGQGAQPIISYNYGARNFDRIREACKMMFLVSGIYLMSLWACIQLFPEVFIRIFNSTSTELLEMGTWTLRLYTAAMGLFFIQLSVQQTFMSIGKVKASLFIACLRKIILLIPLIFILPQIMADKVFAVFLAEPVSDIISITASLLLYQFVFKRDLKRAENRESEA
jgi:putative MATE family efflux protein